MSRFGYIVVLGAAVGGCHPFEVAPPLHTAPQLPVTGRNAIEPDVSAVSMEPAAAPARPVQYHRLTANECRSLAIKNAPLADELDTHPDNTPPGHSLFKKRPELAQMSRLVRGYAADELRNRAAGETLELYYKLLAAEGQFDLVASAHKILATQYAAAEKAIKGGAADRADAEKLRRQMLDLESQLAKLEAGTAVLNAGLGGRLGLDPADPLPIWPADTLRVEGAVPDTEQAVQTALRCRPDLNLLRTISAREDAGGDLVRSVLTSVNPLLSTQEPKSPLVVLAATLKKEPTKAEAKLHQQVVGLLATRERQADAEVRAAAATLRGNRAAVAAKAAEVRNLQAKVEDLKKREAAGQQVTAELTAAQLDLIKLRGELIQAAAEWHIADVQLRQATGMLVRE